MSSREFKNNLITVLEKSLEKNGNQELTVEHLLNIVKLADKITGDAEHSYDVFMENLDCLDPNF